MLCGGIGHHHLVLSNINNVLFSVIKSLHFLSESNDIFQVKNLKRFTFCVQLIEYKRRPNKKNNESLELTRKVNLLRL